MLSLGQRQLTLDALIPLEKKTCEKLILVGNRLTVSIISAPSGSGNNVDFPLDSGRVELSPAGSWG